MKWLLCILVTFLPFGYALGARGYDWAIKNNTKGSIWVKLIISGASEFAMDALARSIESGESTTINTGVAFFLPRCVVGVHVSPRYMYASPKDPKYGPLEYGELAEIQPVTKKFLSICANKQVTVNHVNKQYENGVYKRGTGNLEVQL